MADEAIFRPCPEQDAELEPLQFRYPVAVPSWVFPGTVAENAFFLNKKVAEVGLCCFETRACLGWGERDLPASLAQLDLKWHVHLPADLLWDEQGSAATAALRIMDLLDFLNPSKAVLHPPKGPQHATRNFLCRFLEHWCAAGRSPAMVLLENTAEQSLLDLEAIFVSTGCGVCLDLGHLLRYQQTALLDRPDLLARVGLTHWSAPDGADRHQPLTRLTPAEHLVARRMAELTKNALPLIEVFDWAGIEASWPVLREWYGRPDGPSSF